MAVKWIGDAARELNMDVLEAVELLASKQNYPMNGLLDEDRVMLLKRYRVEATGKGATAHAAPRPAPPPVPEAVPPPLPAEAGPTTEPIASVKAREAKGDATANRGGKRNAKGDEPSSVTTPMPTQLQPQPQPSDKSEERTVIIPPPGQGL